MYERGPSGSVSSGSKNSDKLGAGLLGLIKKNIINTNIVGILTWFQRKTKESKNTNLHTMTCVTGFLLAGPVLLNANPVECRSLGFPT